MIKKDMNGGNKLTENQKKFENNNELLNSFEYIEKVKKFLQKKYGDRSLFAHVHSYGCQQNVSDGEKMMGLLALMGYGFCDSPDGADVVIYNTCAVRENAEDRVFGNIGELTHNKEKNKEMIIGLCGCMTQQEHIANKIKKSYPHVDLIFGTHSLQKLPEMIYKTLVNRKRIIDVSETENKIFEGIPVERSSSYKASVPIMYGCNNFCTYCIVPYVRGREISRKPDDILFEFTNLVKQGCKEITLLGQNVNSYGHFGNYDVNFSKLLQMLNNVEGDFRIRFMSSHPKDATYELIDTIAECDKVCKHFHLPIQSGSDRILDLMNRHYGVSSYMNLVLYARKRIPNIAFTSDIIVGFPTENYDDFKQTIDVIKKVRFDSLFSFIYSKRIGTKAAQMQDDIPYSEKSKWFQELLATQKEIGKDKYKNCVGNTYKILVDGEGKTGKEYLTGRTDGYMIVDFIGDKNLIGKFVNVKVTKALNWALIGEVI